MMCACTAFHLLCSVLLLLLVSSAVVKGSSYMRAYGAKELWPYLRIRCDLHCPFGYETDIEGNYVCLCHDPCQNVLCFGRARCVVELPKLCTRDYCRPKATCRETTPLLPFPSSQNGVFLADDASTTSSVASLPARCRRPRTEAAKNCRKLRVRWYFDDVTGRCESFLGCKTTGNNFRGRRGCEKTCRMNAGIVRNDGPNDVPSIVSGDVRITSHKRTHLPPSPLCSQTAVPLASDCKSRVTKRWFFDAQAGVCRKVRTCATAGNSFSRKRHCKTLCMVDHGRVRRKGRRNQTSAAKQ